MARSQLTGDYRLDSASSEDPRAAAQSAIGSDPFGNQQSTIDSVANRLAAPERLDIQRRGKTISIASSRAPLITFEADGREHTERASDGHIVRTRAVLYGDNLMVSSSGSNHDSFSVNFDVIEEGHQLRVTRHIHDEQLGREFVVQSTYNKISSTARFDIYNEQPSASNASIARSNPRTSSTDNRTVRPQPSPPAIRPRPPQPTPGEVERSKDNYALTIPNGTQVIAVLNNNLSTTQSREGDRFTLTVHQPVQYEGATIEGYVSGINRSGRVTGRSEMKLNFESIRLRDGRSAGFNGTIESVRAQGGEQVRVGNENNGEVQERNSQSNRTIERTAIGASVGAIIGAIAGGGKGAAIGAAVGAGIGAGSVYAQGRDDLDLRSGTELTLRKTAAASR